jgi:hypothetical protein
MTSFTLGGEQEWGGLGMWAVLGISAGVLMLGILAGVLVFFRHEKHSSQQSRESSASSMGGMLLSPTKSMAMMPGGIADVPLSLTATDEGYGAHTGVLRAQTAIACTAG